MINFLKIKFDTAFIKEIMPTNSRLKKCIRQLKKIFVYACMGVFMANTAYAQSSKDLPEVIALGEEYSQEGMKILYVEPMFDGLDNGERVLIVAGSSHLGGTFTNVMKRLTKMAQ